MRVKIIKNAFSGELEEEINKFISNDDIIAKDVKYCVSDTYFSALIIYEERGKHENNRQVNYRRDDTWKYLMKPVPRFWKK